MSELSHEPSRAPVNLITVRRGSTAGSFPSRWKTVHQIRFCDITNLENAGWRYRRVTGPRSDVEKLTIRSAKSWGVADLPMRARRRPRHHRSYAGRRDGRRWLPSRFRPSQQRIGDTDGSPNGKHLGVRRACLHRIYDATLGITPQAPFAPKATCTLYDARGGSRNRASHSGTI
jgi:hypothetical protein